MVYLEGAGEGKVSGEIGRGKQGSDGKQGRAGGQPLHWLSREIRWHLQVTSDQEGSVKVKGLTFERRRR